MAQTRNTEGAISMRIQPAQKALIDKAAALSNKKRTAFILETACREAENVLLDQRLFFVDDKAYQNFISLLDEPVEENLGLKELLKSKSPWKE